MVKPTADELDAALRACRGAYVGPGPCHRPDYLAARRRYALLLVAAGVLRMRDLDRPPEQTGVSARQTGWESGA